MAADCGSDAACESAMHPPDSMMASAPSRTAMAMSDTSALKLGRAALMTPLSATSKVQSTSDSPKQGEQHVPSVCDAPIPPWAPSYGLAHHNVQHNSPGRGWILHHGLEPEGQDSRGGRGLLKRWGSALGVAAGCWRWPHTGRAECQAAHRQPSTPTCLSPRSPACPACGSPARSATASTAPVRRDGGQRRAGRE